MPRHTQYGLLSAFAAVIAIFVLTTNLAMQEAIKHADAVHEILNELTSHPIALLRSLVNVGSSVSSMQNRMESIMLLPDEKTIAQNLADIELEEKKAMDEYEIIETRLAGAEGKRLAAEAQKEFLDWRPLRMDVVNSIREDKNREAVLAAMERNSRHIAKLISSHLEIKKYARDNALDSARKAIMSGDTEILADKIALLIAVLLSGFIAISITRLKQREMEATGRLLQSRQDAQTYLDVAGAMLIALNRAGEITMINRRGCEMLDVAQEDALGKNWFENYLPKDVVDEVKQVFSTLMDGNVAPVEYYENRILTGDGGERILAFHNAILRDAAGRVVGILSSGEDITERKKAESELADFRDWLEHTQKIAHLGSWMQSYETGELKWSDETYRIFGLEPQSVKMSVELFLRMIHPDDRASVVEETRKAQESEGHLYKAEYRIILPDGAERVVYEEATLYPKGKRPRTSLYGYILDITERKRAEEELRRFFNLVPDMVCIASADGRFLKVNPMWQATLGYTEQEILSTPIFELIHPDDREATMKEVERQLGGEATIRFINRYRCKDGGYKWLEWMATPAVDKVLLFAAARDITGRKLAEERLIENEAMLIAAQKISSIGHFKFNPATGAVEGSDQLFAIFGLTREEFQFADFANSVHPDDRQYVVGTIQTSIAQGGGLRYRTPPPAKRRDAEIYPRHRENRPRPVHRATVACRHSPGRHQAKRGSGRPGPQRAQIQDADGSGC